MATHIVIDYNVIDISLYSNTSVVSYFLTSPLLRKSINQSIKIIVKLLSVKFMQQVNQNRLTYS